MKSAHRHQLETNALAHRLEVYIERYRPYASKAVGVLIGIVLLIFIWTYISGASSARRSEAWDTFNRALTATPPNLEELHRTAEDYPGTKMQQLADVTWADGQVFMASHNYLYNRQAAMDGLNKATSAYQGVLQSSKDERLTGRARLGLARIYEMQNHLDKAREQYREVTGTFAEYAKLQADRLDKPESQETYAWLATAKPPLPKAPVGPGTPGLRPEFSPGDISLPGTTAPQAGKSDDTKGTDEAFNNLLKTLRQDSKNADTADRYKTDEPPAKESNGTSPGKDAKAGESKGDAVPPKAAATETKPAETPPPTDKPAK